MEFKKGETLKVVKFNGGWDSEEMKYINSIDTVEIKKIIRRNGVTSLKVWSDLGHGYTIPVERFEGIGGTIEKVGA